jgi:hypothetical protein
MVLLSNMKRCIPVTMISMLIATACAGRSVTTSQPAKDEAALGIEKLKAATKAFVELDSAVAAGYPRTVADCLVHEHHGAMGYHHVNRSYLAHDLAIEKPQILLYEQMPDSTYKLNGVEFILPYRLWPRDSVAPTLMGQTLHQEDNLKIWYLHVWAWRENPNGVFANFHPDVTCPESTRKIYTPFPG